MYTCFSTESCFTVPNELVIKLYLPSIHSSSKDTSVKTHQIIQGGNFWAKQHIPQLNLVHNEEDPVKKEHAGNTEVQPEEKETIQSNQEELEPEIPDDTPMDPLKIVHLDLKGAAPKVKYLEEVGMCADMR